MRGGLRAAMMRCGALGCLLLLPLCARVSNAQVLPEQPVSLANGRLVFGGEVTATIAPEDPGFFNYTSYAFNALRNVRFGVSAEIKASERLQLLGEVRLDQGRVLNTYGLYVRVRPWPARRFDIQAGRIPPTFGAMTRTAYGSGNILIGQPLAYQYLASIRPDAVPATTDDLLRMRGRGWLSTFPVGNTTPAPGVPMVNTSEWDTGVQAHVVTGLFDWTAAVTAGTLSDPQFHDNNTGKQIAGRVVARPTAAVVLGLSLSQGAWIDRSLEDAIAGQASYDRSDQTAIGGDAEFSTGAWLVRGEVIRSTWQMPAQPTLHLQGPLAAVSSLIEGRYKIAPGFYVAVRGDRLGYSTITGERGENTWDAVIWRTEGGVGYSLTRNIVFKGSVQHNRRDGGRVRRDSLVAAQVMYWF